MEKLTGKQRKYLRGVAHSLNPVVHIGKNGLADPVLKQIDDALNIHELIKIKFIDFVDEKNEIAAEIEKKLKCESCGSVGHVFVFFRQNEEPEKRKIKL
ncbi:MAG TPA: ribosome assembly RNA-binding protein YhbY [bacterium]|nr:ribosome assembly RNA-binding protein YhbY [bacterium]